MNYIIFRGNAAIAAEDLRNKHGIEVFALAVNASREAVKMLHRLVGEEWAHQRLIQIPSVNSIHGNDLVRIGRTLCGFIEPAGATIVPFDAESHKTTKRQVDYRRCFFDFLFFKCLWNTA